MKLLRIVGLAAVVGLSGCDLEGLDLDGGGGGGAGGTFTRGFVFVRGENSGRNLFAVDDAGDPNSPLQLTTQGNAYYPTVSRNGRLVAFVFRSGSTSELRTVPTTGTGQPSTVFSSTSTACTGCSNFRFPTFNPSGGTLVFTLDQGGYAKLARVNADGSSFQLLTTGSPYVYGAASYYPDGQYVLASAGYTTSQLNFLVKVGVATGSTDVISSSLGNTAQVVVSRPAVSPDGTRVAFDGRTSGGTQIFVAPLGQTLGSVTQLTSHPGEYGVEDTWPSWRGNTELTFLSNSGSANNIYRISIASSGAGTLVVPIAQEPSYGG
ncbi:lipoprotein LpqB-like beta-propeller protein [Archangium gephyra]|uniref:Lipoprotein n=1 Tax=Archangium gephyra TaxID=48 RepID=A0AAC8TB85_9BACT|nr:LpqB family beta-propeller domain-containing protein [Archangium gephyra]AKI99367.1 putative lipoprotein [Archangium gephyra]REG28086.1 lipoprotein LpqB-like beta-propeller protein [Archangium gephyra]